MHRHRCLRRIADAEVIEQTPGPETPLSGAPVAPQFRIGRFEFGPGVFGSSMIKRASLKPELPYPTACW